MFARLYATVTGGAKKRPEHLHALFSRMVDLMNQRKSIYAAIKHLRIFVGIFA